MLSAFCQGEGASVAVEGILDTAFRGQLLKLVHMLRLPQLTAAQELDQALLKLYEESRSELLSHRAGPFFKALTLFSAGMHISKQAADCSARIRKDAGHVRQLDDLIAKADKLVLPQLGSPSMAPAPDGTIPLPAHASWVEVRTELANLQANGSQRFLLTQDERLKALLAKEKSLCDVLDSVALQVLAQVVTTACKPLLDHVADDSAERSPLSDDAIKDRSVGGIGWSGIF